VPPISILRQPPAFAKTVAATSVATLAEVISPEVVTQAIERSHSG